MFVKKQIILKEKGLLKKILMRANMSPFDNFDASHVISNNSIGTNAGNLIFPYSLCKTLMVDNEVAIDCIRTDKVFSQKDVDRFNAEYDCFVMPLANAFRKSFIVELNKLTNLIERLKIPCIVVGVGIQFALDAKLDGDHVFDKDVKRFVKSVLDKSALLGLRGEITAQYLAKLGFHEDKDFSVIGCISMYMHGPKLPDIKRTNLTHESVVSFSRKPELPAHFHEFIEKCIAEFPNHYFIPQNLFDFRLLYSGIPLSMTYKGKIPPGYPQTIAHESFVQNKVRGFINVPSWLEFLKNIDFSFGSRIHGNIMPILAGTPSFIFVPDARILELARYHNIPHMPINDIKSDINILDIYHKTDFNTVHTGHAERFENYIKFLNANGLDHIYNGKRSYDVFPFDNKIAGIEFNGPLTSVYGCKPEEQVKRRIAMMFTYAKNKIKRGLRL